MKFLNNSSDITVNIDSLKQGLPGHYELEYQDSLELLFPG